MGIIDFIKLHSKSLGREVCFEFGIGGQLFPETLMWLWFD